MHRAKRYPTEFSIVKLFFVLFEGKRTSLAHLSHTTKYEHQSGNTLSKESLRPAEVQTRSLEIECDRTADGSHPMRACLLTTRRLLSFRRVATGLLPNLVWSTRRFRDARAERAQR